MYCIVLAFRSFREAPGMAAALAAAVASDKPVVEAAAGVWRQLWPQERRRQAAFHVFGMELLAGLDLNVSYTSCVCSLFV